MSRLSNRVTDLEQRFSPPYRPWVRIIRETGQTEAEAIAGWEAQHGPLDGRNVVMRSFIDPPNYAALPCLN